MKRFAIVDGDSLAFCAAIAKTKTEMRQAISGRVNQILSDNYADYLEIYIEEWRKPKDNFRKKFFKLSEERVSKSGYKGNRIFKHDDPEKQKEKEEFFERVKVAKQMLVDDWNAIAVTDMEAEDYAIIRTIELSVDYETICCYIDKDLLQYPILYYNYNKRYSTKLTKEQAELRLYRQVATGDMTDNVPGLKRVGAKTVEKLIKDNPLDECIKLYKDKGESYEYFIEQFNLIRIRSERGYDTIYPITKKYWENI